MTALEFYEKYGRIILPNENSVTPWVRDADRAFFEAVMKAHKENVSLMPNRNRNRFGQ